MSGKGDRLAVVARPCLTFSAEPIPTDMPGRPGSHTLADNLSAAAFVGNRLIVGGDEGDIIGLLDPVGRGYRETGRIAVDGVSGIRRLSQGTDAEGGTVRVRDEIDIEGLAFEDGALWIAGSHARRRRRILPGTDPDRALKAIERGITPELGRCLIARMDPDGRSGLRLKSHPRHGDLLWAAIAGHPVLGPFASQSAQENGLDIEGLAVHGQRLMLGCRGPVVGGFAVIIDIKLAEEGRNLVFANPDKAIAVHYLRLDGYGIRDLVRDGEDLLILTGPTMEEPGAAAIWHWREAFASRRRDAVLPDDKKGPVIRIGSLEGSGPEGKPEAIAFLPGEPDRLLVLHDGATHRPDSEPVRIRAQVIQLPGGNR
ncbi:MAG: DUF3616 domain-containing protein [Phreatobacter sp.]